MIKISEKLPFTEVLGRYLSQSIKHDRTIGVALIKLTNMVNINQSYGYETGNMLLQECYRRLEDISKSEEYLYRTAPNEFSLILPFLASEVIVELAASKIESSLMAPYLINECEIFLPPKIGLSFSNSIHQTAKNLCLTAESALAEAKQSSNTSVIKATLNNNTEASTDLHSSLKKAIDNGDFELYLQPQVELNKGSCISFESLIRWKHNNQYIPPDLFITYAEKSELIFPITKWTLNNALRQLQTLKPPYDQLATSVNISGKCFGGDNLIKEVSSALNLWGVSPSRLTLEITETVLMKDLKKTQYICEKLRNEVGVKISIDDFGTGYTSFEFFKQVTADELKIDQSFIKDITKNARDKHIVKSLIDLAQGVGLKTVAEGIENIETLAELLNLGCDLGQGYFIAKPFSESHLLDWLETHSRLVRGLISSHVIK